MRCTLLGLLGLWLLGTGFASAQGLPEGTYASSKEGCTKLQSKTASELGEDLDFYVLTGKGLTGYQQACDFVNVTAHNATSWIATAFCDEEGYTYPDLLAIAKKEEGKLTVVRLTDLTQPSAQDTSSSESSESDQKEEGGKALKDTEGQNQATFARPQATFKIRPLNLITSQRPHVRFWVISGHFALREPCPLSTQKQTFASVNSM